MIARISLLCALSACSTHGSAPPAPLVPQEETVQTFEATVRVDPAPGAKRFQGVWLDREGQEPLLIDYRPSSCWTPFDGRRVTVTGAGWTPAPYEQQVGAAHFRVATLALAAPPHDTALVSVGEVLERTGVVETLAGAPGSKMEGSTWTGFTDTTGSTWQVWDSPADLPADVRIEVRGRAVELSPYAAHMPGPMLWIGAFTRIE